MDITTKTILASYGMLLLAAVSLLTWDVTNHPRGESQDRHPQEECPCEDPLPSEEDITETIPIMRYAWEEHPDPHNFFAPTAEKKTENQTIEELEDLVNQEVEAFAQTFNPQNH
jgi:hypothetical protein